MPDFSKMTLSELIAFTEERAEKEDTHPSTDANANRDASWGATLEIVKAMEEPEVPDSF